MTSSQLGCRRLKSGRAVESKWRECIVAVSPSLDASLFAVGADRLFAGCQGTERFRVEAIITEMSEFMRRV